MKKIAIRVDNGDLLEVGKNGEDLSISIIEYGNQGISLDIVVPYKDILKVLKLIGEDDEK